MPPQAFQMDVLGMTQLNRSLSRFADKVSDYREAWPQVDDTMREIHRSQFMSEGHGKWPPLAASTLRYKRGPGILRETLTLFQSMTEKGGEHIAQAEKLQFTFGTKAPYGFFHQTGTSRMPARPPIDLREEDKREITRAIQRYVVEEVRRVEGMPAWR